MSEAERPTRPEPREADLWERVRERFAELFGALAPQPVPVPVPVRRRR